MKHLVVILCGLIGCGGAAKQAAAPLAPSPVLLSDCTARVAQRTHKPEPPIPEELRTLALEHATKWATDRCYFPCEFEMCGAVTEYTANSVTVYVTAAVEPIEETPDGQILIRILPEAEVRLSYPGYEVLGETLWHSGCGMGEADCTYRPVP